MSERYNYLIRNIGVLTLGNFASKILVFLMVPLYTRVLTTEEYGAYDLAISTVSIAYPLLTLNIVDAVMRFCLDKAMIKEDVAAIGLKYVGYSCVLAGIIIALTLCLKIQFVVPNLAFLLFVYYLSYVGNQFLIQLAKGLERVNDIAFAGVLGTLAMLTANIVLLLFLKWGLTGFFVANILAQAIPALFLAVRLRINKFLKFRGTTKELEKEMLLYCVPLIASVLGWWVNSASDRYVVVFLCGLAANGVLSVAYKIPSIISILQNIFIQAWQISAIKEYGEKDTARFYGETFSVINTLMCAACAWLIFLAKPLARILYANDFYQAWQYVPFLLISSVLNCASGFLGPILSAQKKSKAMAMSAIYGSLVNVVLNIALVYMIGVQGATIATAISSFVIFLVRKKSIGKDIYIQHYSFTFVTWGLLCIQAFVEVYTPFWYVEAFLMLIMFMINLQNIGNIIAIFTNARIGNP